MVQSDSETTNTAAEECCVNSWNEWDPLEEVLVGHVDGSAYPKARPEIMASAPSDMYKILKLVGGFRVPKFLQKDAKSELDEFIHILKSEGIKIVRPEFVDFGVKHRTPNWKSIGNACACPRDTVMIVGKQIIETPCSWRSRYFENDGYRSLFMDYFRKGAEWVSAPRPRLLDSLYRKDYKIPEKGEEIQFITNNSEIVFDAADFVRCGYDLFVVRGNATNDVGIEWLERHLGDKFKIHKVESLSTQPMHIDTTIMPLCPGKMLYNPKYVDVTKLPDILKKWDLLKVPEPDIVERGFMNEKASMCSTWLNMNVLSLDTERVVVEKSQTSMIKALKDWGFKPIPCNFMSFAPFGGAFHCATLDIRRRGTLESYF